MTPIPSAALAVIRAALDDYRLAHDEQATPAGAADHIGMYLVSSGYAITPNPELLAPGRPGIGAERAREAS